MRDLNDRFHCARCGAFVVPEHQGDWMTYDCGNCGHAGRIWNVGRTSDKCGSCAHWRKAGETWVPYGDTNVKASDDYECTKGYGCGGCPDDEWDGADK